MTPFHLNHQEAAAAQIYRHLRREIVTTGLLPGLCLSEKEMSASLGVSRQPVREAFIKLAEARLVEIRPQRGTFVTKISAKTVEDSRFVREALELAVLDALTAGAPEDFIAAQRECIARQREAAASDDHETFLAFDEDFHKAFATAIGREHVWRIIENDKAQWDRVRFLTLPEVSPMPGLADQHEAILDCIAHGDIPGAKTAMRTHLREALATLPLVRAQYPDLFEVQS